MRLFRVTSRARDLRPQLFFRQFRVLSHHISKKTHLSPATALSPTTDDRIMNMLHSYPRVSVSPVLLTFTNSSRSTASTGSLFSVTARHYGKRSTRRKPPLIQLQATQNPKPPSPLAYGSTITPAPRPPATPPAPLPYGTSPTPFESLLARSPEPITLYTTLPSTRHPSQTPRNPQTTTPLPSPVNRTYQLSTLLTSTAFFGIGSWALYGHYLFPLATLEPWVKTTVLASGLISIAIGSYFLRYAIGGFRGWVVAIETVGRTGTSNFPIRLEGLGGRPSESAGAAGKEDVMLRIIARYRIPRVRLVWDESGGSQQSRLPGLRVERLKYTTVSAASLRLPGELMLPGRLSGGDKLQRSVRGSDRSRPPPMSDGYANDAIGQMARTFWKTSIIDVSPERDWREWKVDLTREAGGSDRTILGRAARMERSGG